MSKCGTCGYSTEDMVKFCPECGASIEGNEHPDEPKQKPKILILGGLLLLALIGGGVFYSIQSGSFVATPQVAIKPVKLFASRIANVRSRPTKDSAELGQLTRGMAINGIEVVGIDPTSAWVKVSDGKFANGFVSKTNLVPDEPVKVDASVAGTMTLSIGAEVRAKPDASSPVIENLSGGDIVNSVGKTETGWIEITPKGGGVGYVQAKAFEQVVQYSEDGSAITPGTSNQPNSGFGGASSMADGADSPSALIAAYSNAVRNEDTGGIMSLVDPRVRQSMGPKMAMVMGEMSRQARNEGGVQSIQAEGIQENGDYARGTAVTYYNNNKYRRENMKMVRLNGRWYVQVGG